jgi:ubiquinone biosynthesis protein UbiJ
MSDTPIVDALYAKLPATMDTAGDANAMQDMGALARDLERMCEELAQVMGAFDTQMVTRRLNALAKYQAMKDAAK